MCIDLYDLLLVKIIKLGLHCSKQNTSFVYVYMRPGLRSPLLDKHRLNIKGSYEINGLVIGLVCLLALIVREVF